LQQCAIIIAKKNGAMYEKSMRDKVLKMFETYAEGGSLGLALDKIGLSRMAFYKAMRDDPSLKSLYYDIQASRADMMYDESYKISEDVLTVEGTDPRSARVAADIRMRIAAAFDRDRFGDNVKVTHAGQVDISGALLEARNRSLRPARDLPTISDAQYVELPTLSIADPTDKQSVTRKDFIDPFSD
jgi:peptide deformylase